MKNNRKGSGAVFALVVFKHLYISAGLYFHVLGLVRNALAIIKILQLNMFTCLFYLFLRLNSCEFFIIDFDFEKKTNIEGQIKVN